MKRSLKTGTALVMALAFAVSVVGLSVPTRVNAQPIIDPDTGPAATKVVCKQPTVSMYRNKHNICVAYVQRMLNILGANVGVDQDFGPQTYKAVLKFQANERKKDKKMLVDGVVGPQTWGKLCSYKARFPAQLAKEAGC